MSIWCSVDDVDRSLDLPDRDEYSGKKIPGRQHVGVATTSWNRRIRLSAENDRHHIDVVLTQADARELVKQLEIAIERAGHGRP